MMEVPPPKEWPFITKLSKLSFMSSGKLRHY